MRMPRPKATGTFSHAFHHCISRVVEKRMHFGDREKKRLVEDMRRHAAFGFCRVVTYCMMSNHFHVLVEVPNRPSDEDIAKLFTDDEALENHIANTLGSKAAARFANVRLLADKFHSPILLNQMRVNLLRRMWDVSEFMKGFKQDFTLWFNGTRERTGTLWESRFKSLIVEPGQALAMVAAYIDLNPVRANLVDDPADYQWCGYAQAMAGNSLTLEGLEIVARQCGLESEEVLKERFEKMKAVVHGQGTEPSEAKLAPPLCETAGDTAGWKPTLRSETPGETPRLRSKAAQGNPAHGACGPLCEALPSGVILARYRLALYGDAITVDTKVDGTPGKRGFSREEVLSVIQAGGKVPAAQLIRCKVRHFSDGVAVGSKSFVESIFQNCRELFSPKRKDGARPMRSLPDEDRLFTLRDLRKKTID